MLRYFQYVFVTAHTDTAYRRLFHAAGKFRANQLTPGGLSVSIMT